LRRLFGQKGEGKEWKGILIRTEEQKLFLDFKKGVRNLNELK